MNLQVAESGEAKLRRCHAGSRDEFDAAMAMLVVVAVHKSATHTKASTSLMNSRLE
jgi:hypothetical protein